MRIIKVKGNSTIKDNRYTYDRKRRQNTSVNVLLNL